MWELEYAKLRKRWSQLFMDFCQGDEANKAFDDLFLKYAERGRYYHTPRHLLSCLEEADAARHLMAFPFSLQAGLFGHDGIYDTHAKDNEERSANYLTDILFQLNVPRAEVMRARGIVLATKHIGPADTFDEKLAADIDLTILGKPKEVFEEYEENIRGEYSWVEPVRFKEGRRAVLESFLARPAIYQTYFFRERYEQKARANLKRSIERLSRGE